MLAHVLEEVERQSGRLESLRVQPLEGSHLQRLVSACPLVIPTDTMTSVSVALSSAPDSCSKWNQTFDALSAELVLRLRMQIEFLYNTIRPEVMEAVEAAKKRRDLLQPCFSDYSIRTMYLCPLLTDPGFTAFLESFPNPKLPVVWKHQAPALNYDEAGTNAFAFWGKQDFLPEYPALNAVARQWFVEMQIESLQYGAYDALSECDSVVYKGRTVKFQTTNVVETLNFNVMVFLYLSFILHAPNMITMRAEHRAQFENLRSEYAAKILKLSKNVREFLRLDALPEDQKTAWFVLDQTPKSICVYGPLYEAWVKAGGNPEALLGAVVKGERLLSLASVQKKEKELTDAWARHYEVYRIRDQVAKQKNLVEGWVRSLVDSLSSGEKLNLIEQDLVEHAGGLASYRDAIVQRVTKCLQTLETPYLLDDEYVAILVVAGGRYHYTDAERLLGQMHKHVKLNPSAAASEAALFAFIDYLTSFMCGQIRVIRS